MVVLGRVIWFCARWVLCAMGSVGGREGAMITLGGVATASAKVRRRGAIGAGRVG